MLCTIFASILLFFGSNVCAPEPVVGANSTISALPELTSLDGEDLFATVDTSASQTRKLTWDTATSAMKVILDSIYSPIFSNSAGLASLLSDETGSSGGFVRAGSPTITSPNISAPVITSLASLSVGSDATGDIYYRNSGGNFTRLPAGATNEYLRISGGIPDWDNTGLLTNPQVSSSTFNATTTISASSLTNNAFILNGLAYRFPVTRAASSSALVSDASGNLMWESIATTTSGTISNNNDTACSTGGGTNTDTIVTHNLGGVPQSITISAEIDSNGSGGGAQGETKGMFIWDANGNIRNGFAIRKDGGVTTPVGEVTTFTSSGSGNPSETQTISVTSATSTGFTFRINCLYVTSDMTSTVTNIRWTAER